jgi:hypothetical protein
MAVSPKSDGPPSPLRRIASLIRDPVTRTNGIIVRFIGSAEIPHSVGGLIDVFGWRTHVGHFRCLFLGRALVICGKRSLMRNACPKPGRQPIRCVHTDGFARRTCRITCRTGHLHFFARDMRRGGIDLLEL